MHSFNRYTRFSFNFTDLFVKLLVSKYFVNSPCFHKHVPNAREKLKEQFHHLTWKIRKKNRAIGFWCYVLHTVSSKLSINSQIFSVLISKSMEFKQRLRRQKRACYKTIEWSLYVHYHFWYISLPFSEKQQREMTKFKVSWRTWTHDSEFLILCLNLNVIPTKNVPR